MHSIKYIQEKVRRIGKQLCGEDKPDYLFSVKSVATYSGAPHLEIVDDEYHFVIVVRGVEIERRRTTDLDEIVYWFVSGDIVYLARDWEANHRVYGQDPRRLLFAKEVELLGAVNPDWAEKKERQQAEDLKVNPFNDDGD